MRSERSSGRRSLLLWIERGCLASGVLLLAWAGYGWFERMAVERAGRQTAASWSREPEPDASSGIVAVSFEKIARGQTIGLVEIPRLRFSAAVAEGDDDGTLKKAIGHLPDTPFPWSLGNSVLAGHRDTHFRALRELRIGDELRMRTSHGEFKYRVADKLIVNPEDVSVLAKSPARRLTLVTCYPFSYTGRAPQRFIVIADGF